MKDKYLVFYRVEDYPLEPVIESATEIFNKMEMSDCSGIEIHKIYAMDASGDLEECNFYGKWHNFSMPEYMKIMTRSGVVLSGGYGTDH